MVKSREEVGVFLKKSKEILSDEDHDLDILQKKKGEFYTDPYITKNTMMDLDYEDEDIKEELKNLTVKDYIETVPDIGKKKSSPIPFWVFGKKIQERDVYIKYKIRSESSKKIFCISFHYAREPFKNRPYSEANKRKIL